MTDEALLAQICAMEQNLLDFPELAEIREELSRLKLRIQEPMRLAIVGMIKAGKSTMMNALLQDSVVSTGTTETTFNVNWFKYGESAKLLVHYKDVDRSPEERTMADLAKLTCRNEADRDFLLSIRHIEVLYPNSLLKMVEVIDTPGIASRYKDDADNTLQLLGLTEKDLEERTNTEASKADAIIYIFSKSLSETDATLVECFAGPVRGKSTPINAMGVLSKVDQYYFSGINDPLEKGREIAEKLMQKPEVRSIFYDIVPVCGQLAWGARTMSEVEWDTISSLNSLPPDRFQRVCCNTERFKKEYPDVPPSSDRQRVLDRIGLYGVHQAYELVREGVRGRQALCDLLYEKSGMTKLDHIVKNHFGYRANLIKAYSGIARTQHEYFAHKSRILPARAIPPLEMIYSQTNRMLDTESDLLELKILKLYFEGEVKLKEQEISMLLEITGEKGKLPWQRLGMAADTAEEELKQQAEKRINYWRRKVNDMMTVDRKGKETARLMLNAYQIERSKL